MPSSDSGVEFVSCELDYHPEKPTFAKNPSTLEGQTPGRLVVNGKRMVTIDVHAHCQIADAWSVLKGHPKFGDKNPFEHKTRSRVADIPTRLGELDAMGMDMQALSVGTGHHFYWADEDLAKAHVKIQNEKVAEICQNYPDRFVGFAIVALQHPELAAQQLDYAVKKLNLRGAILATNIEGDELADPKFHPFWAKAEELDVVIFLHPDMPSTPERMKGRGYLKNIIGNPLDTTMALSHMIYEGTLDTFPGLKVVAAHGGGTLASYIGRFDHGHNSNDRGQGRGLETKKPSEYLKKQIYVDSLVFSTENLAHIINECGIDNVVLGTDHPAGMANVNPIAHILSVPGLSDEDLEKLLGGTLKKLLKIDG